MPTTMAEEAQVMKWEKLSSIFAAFEGTETVTIVAVLGVNRWMLYWYRGEIVWTGILRSKSLELGTCLPLIACLLDIYSIERPQRGLYTIS